VDDCYSIMLLSILIDKSTINIKNITDCYSIMILSILFDKSTINIKNITDKHFKLF